jgi:nitrite reductase/ring-hydroxylating ferredoxin subunit
MSLPSSARIRAGQTAGGHMADRNTPFVFDEWYVAAYATEVVRALLKRTILGRKLVFYRTEAGVPVALDDRCAHRSYPLSAGTLEGDTIVCGYHGFRYDPAGNWIEVPSQPRCPAGIGVRSYPLVERGALIWVWMGAGEPDVARLPPQDWLTASDWTRTTGYLHLHGNYVSLHENLLDLTHLSYIHINSFGTPDYARAPFDVEITPDRFAILRSVVPTRLPPIWGKPTGLDGCETAARIARSEFVSPAMHVVNVRVYDSALPEGARPEFLLRTAHLPTPETRGSTHYFVVHGRDFAQGDAALSQSMHDQLMVVFREDVAALELLETVLADRAEDFYEISVASDTPAVAMRRYLKRRAAAAAVAAQAEPVAAE